MPETTWTTLDHPSTVLVHLRQHHRAVLAPLRAHTRRPAASQSTPLLSGGGSFERPASLASSSASSAARCRYPRLS